MSGRDALRGDLTYLFAANYLAAAICWLLLDPNQSAVRRTAKATTPG